MLHGKCFIWPFIYIYWNLFHLWCHWQPFLLRTQNFMSFWRSMTRTFFNLMTTKLRWVCYNYIVPFYLLFVPYMWFAHWNVTYTKKSFTILPSRNSLFIKDVINNITCLCCYINWSSSRMFVFYSHIVSVMRTKILYN